MKSEEIRNLIWDWEIFSAKKENASINEEVLSEYINEFLNLNNAKQNGLKTIK